MDSDREVTEASPVEPDPDELAAKVTYRKKQAASPAKPKPTRKTHALTKLDEDMERRIKEGIPVFCDSVWDTQELSANLNNFFKYALTATAKNKEKLSSKKYPELRAARNAILELNRTILENIQTRAGLPKDFAESAKDFGRMFPSSLKQQAALAFFVNENEAEQNAKSMKKQTLCCAGEEHDQLHTKKPYKGLSLVGPAYEESGFVLKEAELMRGKQYALCRQHFALCKIYYELMYMEHNMFENARAQLKRFSWLEGARFDELEASEQVDRVGKAVCRGIVADGMARYYKLLIFGTTEELQAWGTRPYHYDPHENSPENDEPDED
ncbi:unnamed protein product, partial [Mesorhabditis spiculigera]